MTYDVHITDILRQFGATLEHGAINAPWLEGVQIRRYPVFKLYCETRVCVVCGMR